MKRVCKNCDAALELPAEAYEGDFIECGACGCEGQIAFFTCNKPNCECTQLYPSVEWSLPSMDLLGAV